MPKVTFTPNSQKQLFDLAIKTAVQAKELALKKSDAKIAAMSKNLLTPSSLITVDKDNNTINKLF